MRLGIGRSFGSRRLAAFFTTVSFFALASALSGCGGNESGDGDGGGGSSGSGGTSANAIKLTDANNYQSTSTLEPPEVRTASGEDLDIFWEELTTDMQCHATSPTDDIDKVALLRFKPGLSKTDAAALLTAGELEMADIDGYIQYDTKEDNSETSCKLSDLSNFGTEIDLAQHYKEGNQVYMLLWGTDTRPGTGARSMVFLRPVVGDVNTEVHAKPACDPDTGEGILTFHATLPEPLEIPETARDFDWRAVTKDGLLNEIASNNIDRILVGFFANTEPAELQEDLFDIEQNATDLWEIRDFGGRRTADLYAARHVEDDGTAGDYFTGFAGHGEGTWLLALMCTTCQNPAPMLLTVLQPVAAE